MSKDLDISIELRDYFAAQAMMGQMVNSPVFGGVSHSQSAYAVSVATNAYAVADAMMKAREK